MGIDPSRGFVAIPRGLTDWEWYSEPNTARLFIHLLLTSNWQEKQWQGITIHPGELVTSRAKLAKQLRMSEQSVRTALMHLQSTNCITSKTGPRYSVIAINNYTEIIGSTKQSTSNQPTPNQDLSKITKKTRQSSSACATPEPTPTKATSPVVLEFEQHICKLSAQGKAQLTGYADRLGEELVLTVIGRCADLGAYSWVYVRKALAEAEAQGCKSVEEYRKLHPTGSGRKIRVDRAEPSGNDFLKNAGRRRPLKKKGASECDDGSA